MKSGSALREIACFGAVGLTATAVHYFTALVAIEVAQLTIYAANLIGYLAAVGVSFLGHGKLTFKRELNTAVFARFTFVSLVTFLSSELLLMGIEGWLDSSHRVAMGVVVVFIPMASFLLNKFWVYRHP